MAFQSESCRHHFERSMRLAWSVDSQFAVSAGHSSVSAPGLHFASGSLNDSQRSTLKERTEDGRARVLRRSQRRELKEGLGSAEPTSISAVRRRACLSANG